MHSYHIVKDEFCKRYQSRYSWARVFPCCVSIKIIKLNMILDLARQYKSMRDSVSQGF